MDNFLIKKYENNKKNEFYYILLNNLEKIVNVVDITNTLWLKLNEGISRVYNF
jgi:hypothetical protein